MMILFFLFSILYMQITWNDYISKEATISLTKFQTAFLPFYNIGYFVRWGLTQMAIYRIAIDCKNQSPFTLLTNRILLACSQWNHNFKDRNDYAPWRRRRRIDNIQLDSAALTKGRHHGQSPGALHLQQWTVSAPASPVRGVATPRKWVVRCLENWTNTKITFWCWARRVNYYTHGRSADFALRKDICSEVVVLAIDDELIGLKINAYGVTKLKYFILFQTLECFPRRFRLKFHFRL